MSKNSLIYADALAEFRNTYNMPSYDLDQVINTDRKLRFLNGTNGSTPTRQYARLATATMFIYFESATKLKENGTPTLTGFRMSKFVDDFEKLADAKYRSELENIETDYKRDRFAGADEKAVKESCAKRALRSFNKTLPTVWKENIRAGYTKITDMKTITDSLYGKLSDKNADKEKLNGELTNIVAAYEAMKQVRESRKGFSGFFWRAFNREQNRQEEKYFQDLQLQVEALELHQYDVQRVTDALNGKTILGKEVKPSDKLYRTQGEVF